MENTEYSNSLYQISEILKYIEPTLKGRIPKKIISYFENNKSKDYSWNVDKTLPLEKQELLQTTKEILTVLYKDYMCNDIERIELEKTLKENEVKYQNELREKYDPDKLFKNKQDNIDVSSLSSENISIINYKKESFFRKILRKISSFIKL